MSQDKFAEIDQRLDNLGEGIAALRNQQQTNINAILTLQGLTSELLDIARLHQQGLRISQAEVREMQAEVREMQVEVRQIWRYLLDERPNGQQDNS